VYSNRDKNNLSHNLPNQIRTNKHLGLYPIARFYSTYSYTHDLISNLNPFFITGLTDAEGSFVCIVKKSTGHRLKWRVEIVFQIALHKKDLELLKQIQAFFGGIGTISTNPTGMCAFRVTSSKQILNKIIPHFDKYNLITQKQADYLLFKKIVNLIEQGEHLKGEGIQLIINVRASLNLGLSEVLKVAFPNTIPVVRPYISSSEIPHPEWMAGFITGEGCFFIKITKGRNKAGVGVSLGFQVSQHIRDEILLKSFVTYFKCGHYVKPFQKEWGYFQCTKFSDNYNIIKPFFTQYPIRGAKAKDLADWVEASKIINKGDHLTTEGSSKIMSIKAGMNTGRSLE